MLRPHSRGTVRLRSSRTEDPPAITHHFLAEEKDRRLTLKAMDISRQLTRMPSLRNLIKEENTPGVSVQSDEEKLAFQKELGTTMYHPVGSCRMGIDPQAVVDTSLRLRGLEGLRIVDASIMPSLVSGNTNAATLAIAEKAAAMIVKTRYA